MAHDGAPPREHAAGQRRLRDRRRRGRPRGSARCRSRRRRGCRSRRRPAVGAGGKSHTRRSGAQPTVAGSKTTTSAARPGARRPRSAMPKTVGGLRRQPAHAVLERQHAACSRTQLPSSSVGAQASQSWLACAPASERPSIVAGCGEQLGDDGLVGVQDGHAEARLEIARQRQVEHEVDGVHAALGRDLAEAALLERRARADARVICMSAKRAAERPPRRCARAARGGTRDRRRCASCPRDRPATPAGRATCSRTGRAPSTGTRS